MKIQTALIWIALVFCVPLASKALGATRSLHVIAFTGDPGDAHWAGRKSVRTFGAGDFPTRFTRLYVPVPAPQGLDLGLAIPKEVAALDIDQWQIPGPPGTGASETKAKVETESAITRLSYQLEFLGVENPIKIRLAGEWKGKKFDETDIAVWNNRPSLLAIRVKKSEGLFFALTQVDDNFDTGSQDPDSVRPEVISGEIKPPELLSRTEPAFPKALIGLSAKVRLLVVVRRDGSLDPERARVIRCPHTQFLKASLDEIFKNWHFRPGEKNGQPVDVTATIEVAFKTNQG